MNFDKNSDKDILKQSLSQVPPPANLTLDIFEYKGTQGGYAVRFYRSEFEELSDSKKELYLEWLYERLDIARKFMVRRVVIEKGE